MIIIILTKFINNTLLIFVLLSFYINQISIMRQKWTSEQDELLIQSLKGSKTPYQWGQIADKLKSFGITKTAKQIRSRWFNNLSPELDKRKWTYDESIRLLEVYQTIGPQWRKIAVEFKGKTDNSIKNHFFSLIRKTLRLAVKNSNVKLDTSCTKVINFIKPKVLALFLSRTIEIHIDNCIILKIKVFDFISRHMKIGQIDFKTKIDDKDKIICEACYFEEIGDYCFYCISFDQWIVESTMEM